MDNSTLLASLVLAVVAAIVGAFVAVRLGQSVILGYILAGIVIGPFSPGFVGDVATVQALADIGIVFLMFSIGVQLSFNELLRVGRVAILGGNAQVLLLIVLGYLTGILLGLRPLEALFLGAVVSNSSSTVLTKALSERGEQDSLHGRISLAWSSVQDLGTVVLVVVLSAMAQGNERIWSDLLWSVARAGLFLAVVGPAGTIAFPWLFERVAALRNRELFVLTVAALALGTAYGSTFFGLSLALGAFVAGVVVGESDLSLQILGEVMPLRDVFAGLFFVSVGMLVDPSFVAMNLGLVLPVLGLIVVAKGAISAAVTRLFGYSPRTSLLTGVTLAQSAEFSFLLARLGTEVGAVTDSVYSLMLAGVAASMVLSPILHQVAAPITRWLQRRLPPIPLAMHVPLDHRHVGGLRGHAVICGYGRVGRIIARALRQRGFPFLVIEEDQRVARRLRARGVQVLLGNAANPLLLGQVGLGRARVLVIAMPDVLAARQITEYARHANPNLDIVVRTHSWAERSFLLRRGVGEAVMGELELALEMTRHTLRRFGLSTIEAQAVVQGLRRQVEMEPESDIA